MRKRSMLTMFVVVLMAAAFLCATGSEPAAAQTDEVTIWRLEEDEAILNRNVAIDIKNDDTITYKLDGITEVSHEWISTDENVFVIEEENGQIDTVGKGQGLAKLILRVTATDGRTYEDYSYISVYEVFSPYPSGTTTNDTMLYRHAGDDTDYRNERGTVPIGTKLKIIGVAKDFYRVIWENPNVSDNIGDGKGYVKRSDVTVEPTGIEVNPTDIAVPIGKSKMAIATMLPEGASSESIIWSSANAGIATVNSAGAIQGKKQGVTKITAKTPNGPQAKTTASVYQEINEDADGIAKSTANVYAGAYKGTVRKGLKKGNTVTILGKSNGYYYVKFGKTLGFVEKVKLRIPVKKVVIETENGIVKLKIKGERQLEYKCFPSFAEKKKVSWKKLSGKAVTVNKVGLAKGEKFGSSEIQVNVDGRTAKVRVWVKGVNHVNWIKDENVKDHKGCGDFMEGLCGIGDKVYFVRVKNGDSFAVLYTAAIKGDKIKKEKAIAKIKNAGHINSMEVRKNGDDLTFYMMPYPKGKKSIVKYVNIKKDILNRAKTEDYSKLKTIPAKEMQIFKGGKLLKKYHYSSIAKTGERYVLKAGGQCHLFKLNGNKFVWLHKTKAINTLKARPDAKASKAGAAINGDKYYLVFSFVKKKGKGSAKYNAQHLKELRGLSYVLEYKMTINNNRIKLKRIKTYQFAAENKVEWKPTKIANKNEGYSPQLEMEDVYVYNGRMYFNSEGGGDCWDLLGRNK